MQEPVSWNPTCIRSPENKWKMKMKKTVLEISGNNKRNKQTIIPSEIWDNQYMKKCSLANNNKSGEACWKHAYTARNIMTKSSRNSEQNKQQYKI